MDTHKVVTLMRFVSDGEANLFRSLLEANGVHAELIGEYANDIYPLNNQWAGISLQVAEEDVDKAKEILSAKFDECEFLEGTGEESGSDHSSGACGCEN